MGKLSRTERKALEAREEEENVGLEISECKRFGYRLIPKFLGKGSYARVFLAEPARSKIAYSPKLQTLQYKCRDKKEFRVAIKIVNLTKISKSYLRKYLPREVSSLSQCYGHPNVVKLVDFFATVNRVYIVLEHAVNGDSHKFMNRHRNRLENGELELMDEHVAKRLFRQIVTGVNHMHTNGIAHRDLKLENVLLGYDHEAKVSDFGFAVKSSEEVLRRTHCGSHAYTAPEILKREDYDGRIADMWSLGVLLFVLVQGSLPFKTGTADEVLARIYEKLSLQMKVSRDCRDLLTNLLKMDPEKRPTCSQVLEHPWLKLRHVSGDHASEIKPHMYPHVPCKLDDPEYVTKYMKKIIIKIKEDRRAERKKKKEVVQGDNPANMSPQADQPITALLPNTNVKSPVGKERRKIGDQGEVKKIKKELENKNAAIGEETSVRVTAKASESNKKNMDNDEPVGKGGVREKAVSGGTKNKERTTRQATTPIKNTTKQDQLKKEKKKVERAKSERQEERQEAGTSERGASERAIRREKITPPKTAFTEDKVKTSSSEAPSASSQIFELVLRVMKYAKTREIKNNLPKFTIAEKDCRTSRNTAKPVVKKDDHASTRAQNSFQDEEKASLITVNISSMKNNIKTDSKLTTKQQGARPSTRGINNRAILPDKMTSIKIAFAEKTAQTTKPPKSPCTTLQIKNMVEREVKRDARKLTNTELPVKKHIRKSTNTKRPVIEDGRISTNTELLVKKDSRTSLNTKRPVIKDGRMSTNMERPVEKDNRMSTNTERPVTKDDRTSKNTELPFENNSRTSTTTKRPVIKDGHTSKNTKRPVIKDDRTSKNTERPVKKDGTSKNTELSVKNDSRTYTNTKRPVIKDGHHVSKNTERPLTKDGRTSTNMKRPVQKDYRMSTNMERGDQKDIPETQDRLQKCSAITVNISSMTNNIQPDRKVKAKHQVAIRPSSRGDNEPAQRDKMAPIKIAFAKKTAETENTLESPSSTLHLLRNIAETEVKKDAYITTAMQESFRAKGKTNTTTVGINSKKNNINTDVKILKKQQEASPSSRGNSGVTTSPLRRDKMAPVKIDFTESKKKTTKSSKIVTKSERGDKKDSHGSSKIQNSFQAERKAGTITVGTNSKKNTIKTDRKTVTTKQEKSSTTLMPSAQSTSTTKRKVVVKKICSEDQLHHKTTTKHPPQHATAEKFTTPQHNKRKTTTKLTAPPPQHKQRTTTKNEPMTTKNGPRIDAVERMYKFPRKWKAITDDVRPCQADPPYVITTSSLIKRPQLKLQPFVGRTNNKQGDMNIVAPSPPIVNLRKQNRAKSKAATESRQRSRAANEPNTKFILNSFVKFSVRPDKGYLDPQPWRPSI